jgi:hypothetical protein
MSLLLKWPPMGLPSDTLNKVSDDVGPTLTLDSSFRQATITFPMGDRISLLFFR